MKRRILFLLVLFLSFIPLMAVQKPLFMLYHLSLAQGVGVGDWLAVIWHGLSLDATMAGYLTLLPVLLVLVSVWWRGAFWTKIFNIYIGVVAVIVGIVFAADMALYSFWGFKIDASIWFYLRSPKDAAASVEWSLVMIQVLIIALYAVMFYYVEHRWVIPLMDGRQRCPRIVTSFVVIVMGGLLMLPIRGGTTASTANESRAYFSSNMFLNHSAVNPCFSLLSSSMRTQSYSSQYRFMDDEERAAFVKEIFTPVKVGDMTTDSVGVERLLKIERPNIVMIILESFAGNTSEAFGGEVDAARNLSRAAHEGVMFRDVYANSFRTDRGLVSIINAFPGQPTSSIMKFSAKSQTLPSVAAILKDAGYSTSIYYGGDIDFTNMRSFFYSAGYDTVVGQDGLSFDRKPAQWGYDDEVMFDFFGDKVEELAANDQPFFTTMLTLSSHEPFVVPYQSEYDVPYLNSVAFTDHFLGEFLDRLRSSAVWDNTLVILLPDHSFRYPADVEIDTPSHFHIPMVFTGGAAEQGKVVGTLGTQVDMVYTLLRQMGLPADGFDYSKDLADKSAPQFAFYTFNNGFVFMEPDGWVLWDCKADAQTAGEGEEQERKVLKGKAMLQTLLEDFDRR